MKDCNPAAKTVNTHDLDVTVVLANESREDDVFLASAATEAREPQDFAGQFRFICYFAAGGIGRISKAKDTVFDRVVAVKSLNDDFKDDPQAIQAFIEECRLNAQLDHPSIVPVYAMGKGKDDRWEVVMKLINGSSLAEFIDAVRKTYDTGKISPRQEHHALMSRLEYFLKICEVINYCHSRGVVHGDIKPDNIMMGQFGELYVMDWGCARPVGSVPKRLNGTPNYLPPEFFKTHKVTPSLDIYSLGMLLFELTTLRRGKNPYVTEKSADCTRCDVSSPESYQHYLPGLKINPALKAIILKALDPDPEWRYHTAAELAADVRHYIYDEEVGAAPDSSSRKLFRIIYRNRVRSLLFAGLILALLGGWIFLTHSRANRQLLAREQKTMRQLRLQSYTDQLASAVARNFLLSQAQLLLFADNLIEDMQENPVQTSKFYDNSDYADAKTAPPDIQKSDYYPNPITLCNMVRILPPTVPESARKLLDSQSYVALCNKIACYDLGSHDINEARGIQQMLLSPQNLLQRLYVDWANQVRYSYPGTYENPNTLPYRIRRGEFMQEPHGKKIIWSPPYQGVTGTHRITCRYPMYDRNDNFIGVAGLELRLEKVLAPLLKANADDPIHELYFIDRNNNIVTVDSGKLAMPDKELKFKHISAKVIVRLAKELKARHMQQFETQFGGSPHLVSGTKISVMDGMLLQLIDAEALRHHQHQDIRLD